MSSLVSGAVRVAEPLLVSAKVGWHFVLRGIE